MIILNYNFLPGYVIADLKQLNIIIKKEKYN